MSEMGRGTGECGKVAWETEGCTHLLPLSAVHQVGRPVPLGPEHLRLLAVADHQLIPVTTQWTHTWFESEGIITCHPVQIRLLLKSDYPS